MRSSISITEKTSTIDNDEINFDDIPELTAEDFAKGKRNPLAGKFKDGYTIIVEHADYDEIITVTKKRRPKGVNESKTTATL
jgi:hypothetical protein